MLWSAEKKLKKNSQEILKAYGENESNASLAADCSVKADMRGISTHGSLSINSYVSIELKLAC